MDPRNPKVEEPFCNYVREICPNCMGETIMMLVDTHDTTDTGEDLCYHILLVQYTELKHQVRNLLVSTFLV